MRSGASVSQLFAVSSVPRGGADDAAVVEAGVMAVFQSRQAARMCAEMRRERRGAAGVERRRPVGLVGQIGLVQIAAAGELHLDRVHARFGPAVMAGGPAAAEPAVDDQRAAGGGAGALDRRVERGVAGRAVVGADVELRQLAVEQARHVRCGSNGVVEHDAAVRVAQPFQLGGERGVIGRRTSGRGARRSRLRRARGRADRAARRRRWWWGTARWSPGPDRARRRRDRGSRR